VLESLGVECRVDVAEVIVRGGAIAKRPEPAQKIELLLPEARDVDEGLGSGQHRKQTQQQHLLERTEHLAGLARVWQISEMIQKNDRLTERPEFCRRFRHRNPPRSNQRITTDSGLYGFVTQFFT
jgi:hypothetical protein